jgi:esterase/lipase
MRILGIIVCVTTMGLVGALFFGPRVVFDDTILISASQISADPGGYLATHPTPGVRPGAEKEIIWADPAAKSVTPVSIVYLHGFSATKEEIRPLPDEVAQALGANIFYTRLTGHGRDGAALAEASVNDWINDTAEALEIGHAIGERVLVISTSTGGTLAALAARHPQLRDKMDGIVFISPNFTISAAGADLLTAPFAETFVPVLLGEQRGSASANLEHERWWTTSYPTRAVLPMAAVVKAARAVAYDDVKIPALFLFNDADQVVDHTVTRRIAGSWGGAAEVVAVALGPNDDPSGHVIAGRIRSPDMTTPLADRVIAWARAALPKTDLAAISRPGDS